MAMIQRKLHRGASLEALFGRERCAGAGGRWPGMRYVRAEPLARRRAPRVDQYLGYYYNTVLNFRI